MPRPTFLYRRDRLDMIDVASALPRACPPASRASTPAARSTADTDSQTEDDPVLKACIGPGILYKIRAVAGAGKSTTLRRVASHHNDQKILYVVFNVTAAEDQARRYAQMQHVDVMTLDKLAYDAICADFDDRECSEAIVMNEPPSPWRLEHFYGRLTSYKVSDVILAAGERAYDGWLRSSDASPSSSHIDVVDVRLDHACILEIVSAAFAMMLDQTWPLTHEAIMKKYQIDHASSERRYGIILVDEAQDLSPCQLAVVLAIPEVTTFLVYDANQAINSFRGADQPDVLDRLPCADTFVLPQSWRYGQALADAACSCLRVLGGDEVVPTEIRGCHGRNTEVRSYDEMLPTLFSETDAGRAVWVLARTNLALVRVALRLGQERPRACSQFFFQGGGGGGGPFAYIDECDGAGMVLAVASFKQDPATPRKAKYHVLDHFAVVAEPWQSFASWVFMNRHKSGRNWHSALTLVNQIGVRDAVSAVMLLAKSVRIDRPPHGVRFSTIHKAKGLGMDTILLADDWARDEGAEAARLCYVALTRAKARAWISKALRERLSLHK